MDRSFGFPGISYHSGSYEYNSHNSCGTVFGCVTVSRW